MMFWKKKTEEPKIERKIDYTPILKSVFEEKTYAEYAGETLCYQEQIYVNEEIPISEASELHFISFSREDLTEEERYWLALCYVKYKNGSLLQTAWNIIKSYKGRGAKELLNV